MADVDHKHGGAGGEVLALMHLEVLFGKSIFRKPGPSFGKARQAVILPAPGFRDPPSLAGGLLSAAP
jgi:hypothetical protein